MSHAKLSHGHPRQPSCIVGGTSTRRCAVEALTPPRAPTRSLRRCARSGVVWSPFRPASGRRLRVHVLVHASSPTPFSSTTYPVEDGRQCGTSVYIPLCPTPCNTCSRTRVHTLAVSQLCGTVGARMHSVARRRAGGLGQSHPQSPSAASHCTRPPRLEGGVAPFEAGSVALAVCPAPAAEAGRGRRSRPRRAGPRPPLPASARRAAAAAPGLGAPGLGAPC